MKRNDCKANYNASERRRHGKKLLCVLLCALMFVTMFAGEWDLVKGDIQVNASDAGQTVTQGTQVDVPDAAPVITSSAETANTITVSSSGDAVAQVTIQSVDISTDNTSNAITVTDNSSAVITVSGDNYVDNGETGSSGTAATINVGDNASLTIQGDGNGGNSLNVNSESAWASSDGAGIGSNSGEDFTGKINITGDVSVSVESEYKGAAVGSGKNGDFDGTVNVTDGAELEASSSNGGAAIGAGSGGDFTEDAEVNIVDATVKADTYDNGAAIGSGYFGDFEGTVNIENSDVTAVAGRVTDTAPKGEAAAIGAGFHGDFSGEVSITDSTVTAAAFNDGAVIGAGGVDQNAPDPTEFTEDGVVNIHNSDVTLETHDRGIPIGAPEVYAENSDGEVVANDGIFNGTVNITGDSKVTLVDGRNTELGAEALIGGASDNGSGSVNIDDSAQINYWTGEINYDYSSATEDYKYDQSYRVSTENGTISTADEDALKKLVQNAELTIRVVPKPDPTPSTSAGTKAETTVCVATAYDFWRSVEAKIRACQPGDIIVVNVADHTDMPCYILDVLAECGVDLIIEWNGGEDIEVRHDHGIEYDKEQIDFTVLIELLKK